MATGNRANKSVRGNGRSGKIPTNMIIGAIILVIVIFFAFKLAATGGVINAKAFQQAIGGAAEKIQKDFLGKFK